MLIDSWAVDGASFTADYERHETPRGIKGITKTSLDVTGYFVRLIAGLRGTVNNHRLSHQGLVFSYVVGQKNSYQ